MIKKSAKCACTLPVDIDKVIALAGLWDRKDNNALKDHITKDIIMAEIERQLHTFLIYAQSMKKESATKSYTQAYHTVRRIRTSRNGFADSTNKTRMQQIESDRVYQAIIQSMQKFQKTFASR